MRLVEIHVGFIRLELIHEMHFLLIKLWWLAEPCHDLSETIFKCFNIIGVKQLFMTQ